jgi:hypothetical protein
MSISSSDVLQKLSPALRVTAGALSVLLRAIPKGPVHPDVWWCMTSGEDDGDHVFLRRNENGRACERR